MRDLAHLSKAEHLGEHPGGGIQLPNRQVDCPKTPDPHLPRNRTTFPRNSTLYSLALISREPEPLSFWISEAEVSAVFTIFYTNGVHAEILEARGPPVERCAVGDAQFGSRDF